MTKITPSNHITSASKVTRSKSNSTSLKKSSKPNKRNLKQLQKEVTQILRDESLSEIEKQDAALKKVITWHFGDHSLTSSSIKNALNILKTACNDLPEYAELLKNLKKN